MYSYEIFEGLTEEEYDQAMRAISSGEYVYAKNKIILNAGDVTHSTGLVLEGSVLIESADMWGNSALLGIMRIGELFAASYALTGQPLLVDIRANEDCRAVFLNVSKINGTELWVKKIMSNILAITARKNIYLSERSFINANKSVRRKVMSYLNSLALRKRTRDLYIPFDRQQMADYLNIDRSALSRELCSMRDEGIIRFRKNHFLLI